MATVERRHRETALEAIIGDLNRAHPFQLQWVAGSGTDGGSLEAVARVAKALADAEVAADDRVGWLEVNIADGIGDLFWVHEDEDPDLEALLPRMRTELQRLFRCERELAQLKESPAPPSMAPVTGDRLLAALACHIDHDEPPGMAARELATAVLELVHGADGVGAVILAAKLRGLAEQRKVGARG